MTVLTPERRFLSAASLKPRRVATSLRGDSLPSPIASPSAVPSPTHSRSSTAGLLLPLLLLALALGTAPRASAYSRRPYFWLGGDITLSLQLGAPSSGPLRDGSTSFNQVAAAAAADWNSRLGRVRFVSVTAEPPRTSTDRDRVNNVFFSKTIYGLEFDSRTLAVTIPEIMRTSFEETDVIVNDNLHWDSYRGSVPRGLSIFDTLFDLRRVLLHEFGHALGLGHPDEAQPAQVVSAIMNSSISDTETLQADDIAGINAIYKPNGAVTITSHPTGATKNINEPVSFSVAGRATANEPLFYTWMFTRPGGRPERLELAEEATFVLGGAQPADAGVYQALVYTANGAELSAPATLNVNPVTTSPATRLANISTRGVVGVGSDALISGFVIGGTTAKPVLVRAIGGTTLSAFGVAGALPDPQLTLFDATGKIIAQNNNWSDTDGPAITAVSNRLGGFRLPAGSTDSALLLTLPPGSYTASVAGANNTTGVALVEVYDADADDATALTRKLGNLSTRGSIGPNGNILIAGLVVRGSQPRRFLIRAIGPTLARFGLTTALLDPVLTLHNAAGTQLRYADDWDTPSGNIPAFRAAALSVGGFGLVELRDYETRSGLDSVMIATLAPGNYTAQVAGFGSATGVALVEIYELNP